jgi:hypothetical protein
MRHKTFIMFKSNQKNLVFTPCMSVTLVVRLVHPRRRVKEGGFSVRRQNQWRKISSSFWQLFGQTNFLTAHWTRLNLGKSYTIHIMEMFIIYQMQPPFHSLKCWPFVHNIWMRLNTLGQFSEELLGGAGLGSFRVSLPPVWKKKEIVKRF